MREIVFNEHECRNFSFPLATNVPQNRLDNPETIIPFDEDNGKYPYSIHIISIELPKIKNYLNQHKKVKKSFSFSFFEALSDKDCTIKNLLEKIKTYNNISDKTIGNLEVEMVNGYTEFVGNLGNKDRKELINMNLREAINKLKEADQKVMEADQKVMEAEEKAKHIQQNADNQVEAMKVYCIVNDYNYGKSVKDIAGIWNLTENDIISILKQKNVIKQ